jgi:LuxR family maltose regulon positive regulatory protein
MAGIETAVEAARRYIIKRPRLTRLLDNANSRVLMLIGPAGFGKTTLAREWASERKHLWYQGMTATADVAALAAGLSDVVSELIPEAGNRMIHRMRATGTPEEDVDVLAELFAEDLAEWPEDAWLVFDDYQFAMDAKAPERFIEVLLRDAPVRLLLTSRKRPSWASARRLLYGEVYELGRTDLAMDHEEAANVLAHRKGAPAVGLVTLAEGWPAVIGLAALTDEFDLPEGPMPEALYDYLAEELYQAASPDVQRGMCLLALAPSIGSDVAEFLLGQQANEIVAEALRLGFLGTTSAPSLELHPLLRKFLDTRMKITERQTQRLATELAAHFAEAERWDDAFAVSERHFSEEAFVELLEAALPTLLRHARIPTLLHLLDLAHEKQASAASVDLAEAELAFRRGERRKAETLALQAARGFGTDHPLASHCFFLAGSSAHVDMRHEAAYKHHDRAIATATFPEAAQDALWGKILAAGDLGRSDTPDLLDALVQANDGSPESEVRLAAARHMAHIAACNVSGAVDELEPACHLLPKVRDPLMRTSFKHTYSQALIWSGNYEKGLAGAQDCLAEARKYRLDFVLGRAERLEAMAEIGLRRFSRGAWLLDRIEKRVAEAPDPFLAAEVQILKLRLLVAMGLPEKALDSPATLEVNTSEAEQHEYLASLSLAMACAGRHDEAERLSCEIEGAPSIEVRVLTACSVAICAIARRLALARDRAQAAYDTASETGNSDCFVCAYRGHPPLLQVLAETAARPDLERLLESAHDESIAKACGFQVRPSAVKSRLLSPREREVGELLSRGLTNREIAQKLFLSSATVKVHVRHVLEKLGARTRTEAALLLATSNREEA